MVDLINHPPHYADRPEGLAAECIEYTRHMPFSQGNAFKYLYRAGIKTTDPADDLQKALWYVRDAIEYGIFIDATVTPRFPRINPNPTHRAAALFAIAHGRMSPVANNLVSMGPGILAGRGL